MINPHETTSQRANARIAAAIGGAVGLVMGLAIGVATGNWVWTLMGPVLAGLGWYRTHRRASGEQGAAKDA